MNAVLQSVCVPCPQQAVAAGRCVIMEDIGSAPSDVVSLSFCVHLLLVDISTVGVYRIIMLGTMFSSA